MKKSIFPLIIGLLLFFASAIWGSVPDKMSYEGRLTDAAGNPVTTSKTVAFSIYDSAAGGSLIWGPESISVSPDNQGVFNVTLGNTLPISSDAFSSNSRYLQITVAGENMTPRTRLASVGFSFKSAVAQSVEDGSITRSKAASGQFVKSIIAGSGIGVSGDEGSGTGQVTLTATGTGGGTVTEVNTGTGLLGGPITSSGTISIDPTVITLSDTASQGDLLYYDGSKWARLGAGTSGNYLQTQGASQNPVWASAGTGPIGPTGEAGPQGIQGPVGDKGATGEAGAGKYDNVTLDLNGNGLLEVKN